MTLTTIAIYSVISLVILGTIYYGVNLIIKNFSGVSTSTTTTLAPTSTSTTTTLAPTSTSTTTILAPTSTTPLPPSSNLYNVQDVSNGFSITPSTNNINIGTELGTYEGVVTNLIKPIPSSIYLWNQKPNPYTWGPYSNKINAENIQTINNSYALQYNFNGTINIGGIIFSNGLVGNPDNNYNWNGYNGTYNFSRIGVYLLRNNTITALLNKSIMNGKSNGEQTVLQLDNPVIVNKSDKIFITLYVDTQSSTLYLGNLYFQSYVKPVSPTVSDVSYSFTMNPVLNTVNIGSETPLDTNYYGGGTASTLLNLTKQTQINWNVFCNNQPDNNYIKINGILPAIQSSYALQYIFPDNTSISNILLKNGNLQPSQPWGISPQYYPSRIYVYLLRNGQITNILSKITGLPINDTLTTIPLPSTTKVNLTDKIFVCLYNDNNDGTGRDIKNTYGMSLNLLYFT